MHPLIMAGVFRHSSPDDWLFLPILVVFSVVGFAARYWRFVVQWLNGLRGREWTLYPAVIDVVSVIEQTEQSRYGERVIGYLATLTYFYRNPELQMGEFCRMFNDENEAKAWAEPLKACHVMVQVDPKDPSRSALREDELDSAALSARPIA